MSTVITHKLHVGLHNLQTWAFELRECMNNVLKTFESHVGKNIMNCLNNL